MVTVKQLKEELNKFPDDANCYVYDGSDTGGDAGLVVRPKLQLTLEHGFIFCSEEDDSGKKTQLMPSQCSGC